MTAFENFSNAVFIGALAKINPQFYWGKKKHFSK